LGMQDVVLLVPTLDTMEVMKPLLNRSFKIDAAVKGGLNNLNISKLTVRTLDDTYLSAAGTVRNAMDFNNIFLNLTVNSFRSSRRDIHRLVSKSMLPAGYEIPNSLNLRGKVTGGLNNFRTNLALATTAGNANLVAAYRAGRDTSYQ